MQRREDVVKVRRSAGKRPYEVAHPEVWPALEKLVDPITRGDPESPLRWTCKSTHALSAELFVRHGIRISHKTVAKLLRDHGYSLQAPNKSVEGAQHPDRNAQFEHINAKAQDCVERGVPVISVDTKKKELVGNFKNGGREWQPEGRARPGGRPRLPVRCGRQGDPVRRLRPRAPTTASSASASTTTRRCSR